MIDEFADALDPSKVHVLSPTQFVFLCGGRMTDLGVQPPVSLRDAFYKIVEFEPLKGAGVVRAEDIEALHIARANYSDLLSFELDLAQLAKLTVIFSESHGSLAELGAFCLIPEIAKRMLVLIRSDHYEESSFIRLGIVDFMNEKYGELSHFVMDKAGLSLSGSSVTEVTANELQKMLSNPVTLRISEIENPTTFNAELAGHRIKLVVGLIQEFGALTPEEISTLLLAFELDVSPREIDRYLLCAEAVGWVVRKRKGFRNFAAARDLPRDSANFRFKPETTDRTASRRRAARRSMLKDSDPERFAAILDGMGIAHG